MEEIELTIFNVSAKGNLGRRVDLNNVIKSFKNAFYNERVKGGRVEIKILDGEIKIGTIMLSASGSFSIFCKDLESMIPACNIFTNRMERVYKMPSHKKPTEKLPSS